MAGTLCRLEYLTPAGWQHGHAGVELLHPERYIERLAERGKFGRVTLLETGEVLLPQGLPDDPSILVPDTDNPHSPIPRVPPAPASHRDLLGAMCQVCDERHLPPYDGTCLL